VKSPGKSKTSKSLSGEYVVAVPNMVRIKGRWPVSDSIRWQALPEGVAPEPVAAAIAAENQIAETGILPAGMEAPDFEFVVIDSGERKKLSDFRGQGGGGGCLGDLVRSLPGAHGQTANVRGCAPGMEGQGHPDFGQHR